MTEAENRTGTAYSADRLAKGLSVANVPTLLMVLVHLTGDRTWLTERYRPTRPKGLDDNDSGGLPPEAQQEVRQAALEVISAHLADSSPTPQLPEPAALVEMMSFAVGEEIPTEYGSMMAMDLGDQLSSQQHHEIPTRVPEDFRVLVVGAGPCGIAAGVALKRASIPFTIVDPHDNVAGTWRDNGYPGAAVDTPSHLYSFSFAPHDWSRYFASRDEIQSSLVSTVDKFGLEPHIRLRCEVRTATYDVGAQSWHVEIRNADSKIETLETRVVISAVGALNRPKIPAIPGLSEFAGPSFHTARWPEGLDLRGKRVGVVGTGASAMQTVPAIADTAESVTVFQRSPQWAAPFEKFKVDVPQYLRDILSQVDVYRAWYRLRQGWIFNDKVHPSLQKDPAWADSSRSINSINEGHRRYFTKYILGEIEARPELAEKVVPTYPPYGKRMLLDNGWFRTMCREDVVLETDGIAEVRSDRVVTASGVEHVVDVLVLATGFDATNFLASYQVTGRSGTNLRTAWDGDDARAFLGVTVPDFPNFFMLNGPNTQTGHGGSLLYLVECQLRFVMSALTQMLDNDLGALECRSEVYERYSHAVDQAHERMIWTHPDVHNYYRNSRGRVVLPSPWRIVDFWSMTRRAHLDDFHVEPHR
ncbi:flavin-containing monooxygenase [Sciscionella marina]|uniref:flavin-containing monooxygenase n=1 Tax=Sciscionella marina TaxID=508770 RepID=UPI000365D72C|nr:NAD(P)/FAD-dependent oxidoreductase [Sciscionella marina]